MENLKKTAGVLLVLSGIIHLPLPLLFGTTPTTIMSVGYGVLYLVIGCLLLAGENSALLAGVILPIIGFIGAVMDYIQTGTANLLIPFLILIYLVVISLCIIPLIKDLSEKRAII